jgi:alpha-beta hydrolase superfamily lysophospholipase
MASRHAFGGRLAVRVTEGRGSGDEEDGERSVVTRWLVRAFWAAVLIFATLIVGGAVDARRRLPDLESWHRYVPADATAADLETATLAEYLRREDAVFRDVQARIERTSAGSAQPPANRYDRRSRSHPSRIGSDANRTYEVVPAAEIVGGALLIHGLTDSPYSMRAVGDTLKARGYYGLALRMPGHGTVPAGLTTAVWEDWLAAVRVGVRHVRERIGPDKPLVLVGYSNGGALVLKYAMDEIERGATLRSTRLILISPMIGVAPFAWMSRVISLLGPIPYFEKARWLDVMPEYNPFKYNSFPANAAVQSWRLSTGVQAQIRRLGTAGRLKALPPVLAFQSLVDATVSTAAVIHALFDALDDNGSELVLFDINRLSGLEPFIDPAAATILSRLTDRSPRRYGRALVTNAGRDSLDVVERSIRPEATEILTRPLGLSWPPEMFSLAHIALPFTIDDDVYGRNPRPSSFDVVRLGTLSPRGERAVLTVPLDTLMRISCNPFFPYLAARVTAWTDAGATADFRFRP